jgi:hypothetical protein
MLNVAHTSEGIVPSMLLASNWMVVSLLNIDNSDGTTPVSILL